jgi:hypothetical protein
MMSRRQLFTWWRRPPRPARAAAPPRAAEPPVPPLPARAVEPVWIDDPAPFSLDAFYRARAEERRS